MSHCLWEQYLMHRPWDSLLYTNIKLTDSQNHTLQVSTMKTFIILKKIMFQTITGMAIINSREENNTMAITGHG